MSVLALQPQIFLSSLYHSKTAIRITCLKVISECLTCQNSLSNHEHLLLSLLVCREVNLVCCMVFSANALYGLFSVMLRVELVLGFLILQLTNACVQLLG